MKKVVLLLALTIFIGCSKSDDGAFEGKQQDLAGTWIISKEVFDGIDITSELSDCDKRGNIVVDLEGNAVWENYLDEKERCESFSIKLTFTAESSVYFDIDKEDLFSNSYYMGEFKGKNTIQLDDSYSPKDGPKAHTVYQFKRQ